VNSILTTVALTRDRTKAVKVELMFDEPPGPNECSSARAEASALFRRRYQEWAEAFTQTVKDRVTGVTTRVYPDPHEQVAS
jgi:hypothetical protein